MRYTAVTDTTWPEAHITTYGTVVDVIQRFFNAQESQLTKDLINENHTSGQEWWDCRTKYIIGSCTLLSAIHTIK